MAKSVSQELSKHFDQGPQAVIFRFFFISHLFFIGELIIKLSLLEFFFKFKFFSGTTGNQTGTIVRIFRWIHFKWIRLEFFQISDWAWIILHSNHKSIDLNRVKGLILNMTWYDEKSRCKWDLDFPESRQQWVILYISYANIILLCIRKEIPNSNLRP